MCSAVAARWPPLTPVPAAHTPAAAQVDFSNVAGEITRLEESARQREREQLRPQDTPASGKGVAFHAALAKATGVSGMPELPPELASLPQPARVRKLAGPLNQLFTQYDNGAWLAVPPRACTHAGPLASPPP